MKNIVIILTINFLICHCLAEFTFSGPFNSFLSFIGVTLNSNPEQFAKIPTDSNLDQLEPEREHESLDLLLMSFDGKTMMGTIGNPTLLGQYIRGSIFVDILFTCPKKTDKDEKKPGMAARALVIETTFMSIVKKYKEEAKLAEEMEEKNAKNIPHLESGNTNLTNDQDEKMQPNLHEDVPQPTAMELDSGPQKDAEANTQAQENNENVTSPRKRNKRENSSELIATQDDEISKKSKSDSVGEQAENLGQDKMEIDPVPNQKPNEILVDPDKTKISDSQSGAQNGDASNQISRAMDSPKSEIEKYWMKALDEARNYKCEKPITTYLFQYPGDYKYKIYAGGFEIIMDNYKNFLYPEFNKAPNQKHRWFWSFTIIMNESDRTVICVYQEFQYNKDTYSPQINEDFDDHDMGKDLMFPEIDISQLYEPINQEKVFKNLFQNENERKKYFDPNEKKILVRVHLAPLHGFVSSVVRQLAKTYGNIAPMYNSIRNGAWRKLEDYISIVSHVLVDLVVITGTYGILNLEGKHVYLANDKIPVPLAFWKMVIYGSETEKFRGILIITSNNPYKDIGNVICEENKCKKYGWGYVQEEDIVKGRTICCDFTPKILEFLPILEGAQPRNVLDLNHLSLIVEDAWEWTESGVKTTWAERNAMLDKLELKTNNDKETVATDGKIDNNVENEEKVHWEGVPQLPEATQGVAFLRKRIVM